MSNLGNRWARRRLGIMHVKALTLLCDDEAVIPLVMCPTLTTPVATSAKVTHLLPVSNVSGRLQWMRAAECRACVRMNCPLCREKCARPRLPRAGCT